MVINPFAGCEGLAVERAIIDSCVPLADRRAVGEADPQGSVGRCFGQRAGKMAKTMFAGDIRVGDESPICHFAARAVSRTARGLRYP